MATRRTVETVQPFTPAEVRKRIRGILEHGEVLYAEPHISQRMAKRRLERADVWNVLQRGVAREGEWENGEWRYRLWTAKITVVVSIPEDALLVVVTCWRNES